MGPVVVALAAAAAFVAYAIFSGRQIALMAAVVAYAAVVGWTIYHDLSLLMAALCLAIILGGAGLVVVIRRTVMTQDDTL